VKSKLLTSALIVLLLIVGGVALERAIVTDAEELDLLFEELADALADEERAAMAALLADPFSYGGPRPLGRGDRDDALEKLGDFWEEAEATKVTSRQREVLVEGNVGVIKGSGHVRFEWSGGMVLYKVSFEIAALRTDDGWTAQGVQLTELTPGLF
jgi:hypothetical protein